MRHFWSLVICLSLSFSLHARDGGWVSSGGDGVVCFTSESIAAEVEIRLRRDKTFPAEFTKDIERVISLEAYEEGHDYTYRRLRSKTFSQIVEERRELIKKISPLFYFYFQLIDEELNPKNWIPSSQVQEIDDSIDPASIRKEKARCVLAQIFDRQSLSRPGQKPQLKIIYQPELWQRLSPLDQALLYFHEALYTLGREMKAYADRGHENSVDIRKAARYLLSDILAESWESQGPRQEADRRFDSSYDKDLAAESVRTYPLRVMLNRLYGDFALFFPDDIQKWVPAGMSLSTPSQASRYVSFFRFVKEAKRFMELCQVKPIFHSGIAADDPQREDKIIAHCKHVTMSAMRMNLYLDTLPAAEAEEMAFVIAAYWTYDIARHVFPSESILVWEPGQSPIANAETQRRLRYVCQRLQSENMSGADADGTKLMNRALKYCARL